MILKENNRKTSRPIYSQKLAGYLMQRGFVLIDMVPDKKNTRRNVFFFYDTPELESAVGEYQKQ